MEMCCASDLGFSSICPEGATTTVSAARTRAGSPRGEGVSIVELYTEVHFWVAVCKTYSKGERVLEKASGRVEGLISTL